MFWNNPQALTDDEMQAASSFFLPLSLFLVAFFLSTPQPVFQSFISLSLARDSSGSQTIHFKRMERFSASIRGENWLRRGHNRQVAVVGSLWEKVYSICICSTWLMCGKTAETHSNAGFSIFPDHYPLTEFQAAVWLEDLLTDCADWGFGQSQHSCCDNLAEADKVMVI